MNDVKIRLGGLWQSETRGGATYLSGPFGSARLLIFENKHRRGDNDPSHVAYIVPNNRGDDASGDRSASGAGSGQSGSAPGAARGSFSGARGVRQAEPRSSDPAGVERFTIEPGETEPSELDVPF
jgi:hypothetical protein